jgi:hypothetical protein
MGFGTPGAASTQVFYAHPTDLAIDASPRVLPERIEVGAELGHDRLWLDSALRSPASMRPEYSSDRTFNRIAAAIAEGLRWLPSGFGQTNQANIVMDETGAATRRSA